MIELFKNSNFLNLFLGRVFTVTGNSFLFISVLKWLELHSTSSNALTLLFITYYLPGALFSFLIGNWVEKKTFQNVMIFSDVFRIIIYTIFVIFIMQTSIDYQWVYLVIFLDSLAILFFYPANQSLLPKLVSKEQIITANSLLQFGYLSVHILGHIISSILIKIGIEIEVIIFIAILLNCISLIFISKIKPYFKNKEIEEKTTFKTFKEGLSYIFEQKLLLTYIGFYSIFWLIDSSVDLQTISVLTDVLDKGAEDIAFFNSSYFLGSILGSLVSTILYKTTKYKFLIALSFLSYSLYFIVLISSKEYLLILSLFFIVGVFSNVFAISLTTFIQNETSSNHHAKIFGFYNGITHFSTLPGMFIFSFCIMEFGVIYLTKGLLFVTLILFVMSLVFAPTKFKNKKSYE